MNNMLVKLLKEIWKENNYFSESYYLQKKKVREKFICTREYPIDILITMSKIFYLCRRFANVTILTRHCPAELTFAKQENKERILRNIKSVFLKYVIEDHKDLYTYWGIYIFFCYILKKTLQQLPCHHYYLKCKLIKKEIERLN